ncbi:hypothetical protein [Lysobacter sp. Root690]|uniref:hypothetical protein n=1 Tax=Lysobacter sp. Root690 TaxID=1736588 RepID=UPI000ABE8519|nr:hypothetical protein [Lysobacter sp. Root690]
MGEPTGSSNGQTPPPSGSPTPPPDVRLQPFGIPLPQPQWPDMSATGPWPLPPASPPGTVPGFRIPPSQDPLSVLGPGLGAAGLTAPVTLPGRSEGSGITWSGNTPLLGHFQRQTITGADGSVTSIGATLTDPRNGVVSGYAGASTGPFNLAIGGNSNGFVAAGSQTNGVDTLSLGVAGNLQTQTYTGFGSLQLGVNQWTAQYSQSPAGASASLGAARDLGGGTSLSAGVNYNGATDTTRFNGAYAGGAHGFNLNGAVVLSPQGTRIEGAANAPLGTNDWLRLGVAGSVGPGDAHSYGPTVSATLAPGLTANGQARFERDLTGRDSFTAGADFRYRMPDSPFSVRAGGSVTDGRPQGYIGFDLTFPFGGGSRSPAPSRDHLPDRRSALEPPAPVEGRAPTGPRTASAADDPNALIHGLMTGDRGALDAARNLPAGQEMRRQAVATVDRQEQQAAQAPETQQAVQPDAPSRGARSIG